MGSSVATGVRSLKGQASLTPPGGVPRKSLKGARSSAHSALQQEPLKARFGLPPGAWEGKCSPLAGVAARWGPPGAAPRSPGSGLGCGWRADPKFSKGLAGQLERRSAEPGMARVAADRGRLGAAFPGGASGKDTASSARPSPGPAPRALGALWPRSREPQHAGGATRLRAFPPAPVPLQPARPAVAPGHAGRSRSAAGQARPTPLRPRPGPPLPAFRRCAPRLPHLQPLAIFTPPSAPARAPDSVLSN